MIKRYKYLVYMFGAVFITMPWYQKLILLLRVSNREMNLYNEIVKLCKSKGERK